MLDRVEGRLAFMKAELKITEPQAPAWNQLAEAVRAAAKQHNERIKAVVENDRLKTLPERLTTQEQLMSARLDGIKQIRSSVENLYMVLSAEQRKEADDMMIPMVGMGNPWS
ncbi:MAG: Spy/CpxP family protein refolding chaperone [Rhodospirillales bacterium]|nr:Spy/CpxP family protein refolding chaperone [Rhodospirillales bacterium]